MKAVKHKWTPDGYPHQTEDFSLTEEQLIRCGWDQSQPDGFMVRVLYDNGQVCTFKRKARSTKDNE